MGEGKGVKVGGVRLRDDDLGCRVQNLDSRVEFFDKSPGPTVVFANLINLIINRRREFDNSDAMELSETWALQIQVV